MNVVSMDEECRFQPGKLVFVDLEYTHVSSAVYDLAYTLNVYLFYPQVTPEQHAQRDPPVEMEKAFLESYLTAMGDPATKEDVDALMVDVRLARMTHHFGELTPYKWKNKWKNFKSAMAELLASAEAQELFLQESGAQRWTEKVKQMPTPSSGWTSDWKPKGNATANHSIAKPPCLGKGKGTPKRGIPGGKGKGPPKRGN